MISLLLLFFVLFIHVAETKAVGDLYFDDFNSEPVEPRYSVFTNGGYVGVNNSVLSLSAPYGVRFPFVKLNYSISNIDNYAVDVRYRFSDPSNYGVGVTMVDKLLSNGIPISLNDIIFHNWGDGHSGFEYRLLDNNNQVIPRITYPLTFDWRTARYERVNGINKYYINSTLLGEQNNIRRVLNIAFGNPENRGSNKDNWTSIHIDYIAISSLKTINPFSPYYSQKDEAWIGETYDHADNWSRGEQGIDRWGCAVTSAAMLLANYGIKSPSGETTDPKVLNNWLKAEDDGYVGQGLLNWLAVTRYANKSKSAGNSLTALEFVRQRYNMNEVSQLLSNGELPIIQKPGHFVLAYDEDGSDWVVADPSTSNDARIAKDGQFVNVNRLIKSNTDLSYILLVLPYGANAELEDQSGNHIPLPKFEEYLREAVSNTKVNKASDLVYLPKPNSGTYKLKLSYVDNGMSLSKLEVYLYDQEGEVKRAYFDVSEGKSEYEIVYDNSNLSSSSASWIDDVSPSTPIQISPADGTIASSSGLLASWSEVSDVSGVRYEIKLTKPDASIFTEQLGVTNGYDMSRLSEGKHKWSVRACDKSSNYNCSSWSPEWEIVIDNTAPVLFSKSVFGGWYTTEQTSSFVFTDKNMSDDYEDPSCVIITGGKNQTCSVDVSICDKANNCTSGTWTSNPVDIDKDHPSSDISPIDTTTWGGKIVGKASDLTSGIQKIELVITKPDGQVLVATAEGRESWSYELGESTTSGKYLISSRAFDVAGNVQVNPTNYEVIVLPSSKLETPRIIWVWRAGRVVVVRWTKVAEAKSYTVWYGKTKTALTTKLGTTSLPALIAILPSPVQTYYLSVVAESKSGVLSDYSPIRKVGILGW